MKKQLHSSVEQILRHFAYGHLSEPMFSISQRFHDLAWQLAEELEGPELTVGLRKLLEAKDCCVRAALPADTS